MKLGFSQSAARSLRTPASSTPPQMEAASVAAVYRAARTGGDFFDFEVTEKSRAEGERLLLLLLDIAGRRDEALDIAAAVQQEFHARASELFGASDVNEADALGALAIHLNRKVMEAAGGVRCSPAFLASYDEGLGTMFYVNAGHTPALVRDDDEVTMLGANGLPLGLFSHATHDAQPCVLEPGAALLVASKGLLEARSGRQEFGLERLRQVVQAARFSDARELCAHVLEAVEQFTGKAVQQNDITTVGLMRSRAPVAAVAAAAR